jgi:hypothetical protein
MTTTTNTGEKFYTSRKEELGLRSYAFCQALLDPQLDPARLIATRFVDAEPKITEHGPPWCRERLPFLAKTFVGREGCLEYFRLLGDTLRMHMGEGTFPGPSGFIVDEETILPEVDGAGVVCVVGRAKFESVKTGRSWDEQFIYRLSGFDSAGRIGHWEIWADPLSAWDAVGS